MVVELNRSKEQNLTGPYNRFIYALKAPESKRQYPKRFEVFLNFIEIEGMNIQEKLYNLYCKAKSDIQWLQDALIDFIMFQKERVLKGEITDSTIPNYYKPIKLFCDMNDIIVNWKLVTRGMPRGKHAANDRAPTVGEIRKLLDYPDRRLKPIVLMMISSGIRISSFDYLKFKHIAPLRNEYGKIIAAKMIVYAGEPEQYLTFISPEAYQSWIDWMDFRASYGEKVTRESWVMRDMWKTTNITYGAKLGYAKTPVKLKSSGIRSLLAKALFQQNVRPVLQKGDVKRHEFKTAHGFRKFFKTQAEQYMLAVNVELLLGHDLGLSSSYYKPREQDLLTDYLKAVPNLTIYKDKSEILTKEFENERIKMKEEHNQAITQLRSEIESKFQQLVLKIDAERIIKS
jgi:hypothetical protein